MKKLRNSIILLTLVCLLFLLSACSSLDIDYMPGNYANQEIWVCDEKDMWFISSIEPRIPSYGELTLDDEIIPIDFGTTPGPRIYVCKPADPEESEEFDVYLFGGSGRFRKKKFKMRLFEAEDIFNDGTETLTFRLLENDDERAEAYLETYNSLAEKYGVE